MRILMSGKNMELSDSLRNLFEKKARKLERYFRPETDVMVTFSQEGSRQMIEVTIPFDGVLLRAEESSYDIYASIDNVLERVERQVHKHRKRLEHRLNDDAFRYDEPLYGDAFEQEDEEGARIVRTKRFAIKPMDAEEAVAQMELIGHTFFVYLDADTEQVCVVYKRRDGNYGLIEPTFD
nr:ribosome-associated translation inhibitor RaiA [Maliibacterium massiliense]